MKKILSTKASLSLGFVDNENDYLKMAKSCNVNSGTIYVDLNRPKGHSIILTTMPLLYSEDKQNEIRQDHKKHYYLCRNFRRQSDDHQHHPKSYYSEMGSWGKGLTAWSFFPYFLGLHVS